MLIEFEFGLILLFEPYLIRVKGSNSLITDLLCLFYHLNFKFGVIFFSFIFLSCFWLDN